MTVRRSPSTWNVPHEDAAAGDVAARSNCVQPRHPDAGPAGHRAE
ncbi:putative phosphoglycerate mutase domain protein [Mycobacterium xenopi 3993]|nr:putative phosphoglycerate mutase domain protein [Mycobacterium xenopi 3993]